MQKTKRLLLSGWGQDGEKRIFVWEESDGSKCCCVYEMPYLDDYGWEMAFLILRASISEFHGMFLRILETYVKADIPIATGEHAECLRHAVDYLLSRDPSLVKRDKRIIANLLLQLKKKSKYIDDLLGEKRGWTDRLIKQASLDGRKAYALDARGLNGTKRKYTSPEIVSFVADRIRKTPGERWTGVRVAQLMETEFGLEKVRRQAGSEVYAMALEIIRTSAG